MRICYICIKYEARSLNETIPVCEYCAKEYGIAYVPAPKPTPKSGRSDVIALDDGGWNYNRGGI